MGPAASNASNCHSPRRVPVSVQPRVTCQICYEASLLLSRLCGAACRAAVCHACLERHISASLETTLPGILPRVRCPVCLTRLAKPAWQPHVAPHVTQRFESLCAKACAFIAPCCENAAYSQLPCASNPQEFESFVDVRLHPEVPRLRSHLAQFEAYALTARGLATFLDELVRQIGYTPLSLQEFVDDVAMHLRDDERRAALVLAFHGLHRRAITRCCFAHVCFCCKRQWDGHHDENPSAPCSADDLTDSDMVQCRACRVTLVKVEGCDAVECPCGFAMSWWGELDIRKDMARGAIPTTVDPLDLGQFSVWDAWRGQLQIMMRHQLPGKWAAWRQRQIERAVTPHRLALRRMLQIWLWRQRFQAALPSVLDELRLRIVVRRLKQLGFFVGAPARMRLLRRLRRRRCLRELQRVVPMFDEERIVDAAEMRLAIGLFDG